MSKIDEKSLIFWENDLPFLEFRETNNITFQGENILDYRTDVDKKLLLRYISSFYRHFPAITFVKILKESSKEQIQRLSRNSKEMPIVLKNNVILPKNKYGEVPFNYEKSKEIGAFHKPNTLKILSYLVLSGKYAKHRIPFDLVEANIFFKNNFKGNKNDVFKRCCEHHGLIAEEVLSEYDNTIKCINYYAMYNDKDKKKINTVDILLDAFFKITK